LRHAAKQQCKNRPWEGGQQRSRHGKTRNPIEINGLCLALTVAGILVLPANARSGDADDKARVERGRAIAENVCWACHVVGADQRFSPILREPGPDFRAIAAKPDTSAQSLGAFLKSTHRMEGKPYAMPDPRLTDDMIEQVVSYIMSLRQQP
jgi:mono/diheme cytochrome c family protein